MNGSTLPFFLLKLFILMLPFQFLAQSKRLMNLENWLQDNESASSKTVFDTLNIQLSVVQKSGNKEDEVGVLLHLSAMSIMRLKDFEKAISFANKIREIANKQKTSEFMVDYYNIMGEIYYYELMNKDRAIRYYDSAVSYGQQYFPNQTFVRAQSHAALTFMNQKDYKKALAICHEIRYPE